MGTSTSSAGAGAGVSFDPPWLDETESSVDTSQSDTQIAPAEDLPEGQEGALEPSAPTTPANAPSGRYQESRTALTRFIRSGSSSDLRRGISSFVRKGMGGSARAASRMRTSAVAASALGGFLSAARDGTDQSINQWVESIRQRGLSAQDVALEVVQKLLPTGGAIDEDAAQHAMDKAILHLYELNPNVDIFDLGDDQIADVMAFTIGFDVFNRVQLELGRIFERLRYTPAVVQARLGQALDYVLNVVKESMQRARSEGVVRSMREIATSALKDALVVFGEP